MNAHSQGDDPALTHVMQFNADEREYQERHLRKLVQLAETLELSRESIDTVVGQQDR